ncbi:carboxymuconolactone decarboxylase family protein [Leifsonia shinshuensis]|uniref:carboxymuconolactone decarboxylase family protein n=1 Tax=Leifsonia shinshuensis TaxID=150026 RepID=UPI001F50BC59|nr:carboxymuconolactone decarboxylase family protein [Leifsonia shinshuensis]MCI0158631.1 carboxymuconolactone decarboxylase family protein [Leifsonia shinshuensis]
MTDTAEQTAERLQISSAVPEGYRKVINLDGYVGHVVEEPLGNLIKLRASQINGCTYCVDMHSVDLTDSGYPLRKVFAVSAWRESPWFSHRERTALELTEAVTLIHQGGVSDELYAQAVTEFGEQGFADFILAIGTINIWNRIAIPTHMRPPAL